MLIRVQPAMTVLYSRHQCTLGELGNYVGTAVRDLYKYVVDLDLLICGPQYWFYYGADGQPDTRFTLDIVLPVQGMVPTTLLPFFKEIPSFKCLSCRYEGPWDGLGAVYGKMMKHIGEQGLAPNGMNSESYLHIDFTVPKNNITEVSIGLI